MSIGSININEYQVRLGGSPTTHKRISRAIQDIIQNTLTSLTINKVDFYNLDGKPHQHNAGEKNRRVVIFTNAVAKGSAGDNILAEPVLINGLDIGCTVFHSPYGDGKLILSAEGYALAEWREGTYELNILFNLFSGVNEENAIKIFEFIMKEFERLVWYVKTLENSWKSTTDKDALTKRFVGKIKQAKENQIREDKRQIEIWEEKIREYARSIKSTSDNLAVKRRSVLVESENVKNVADGLLKDMDLIISNPKVKDLHIIDNKFIIYTNELHIFSDRGKEYYGGEYRIEIVPDNTDVAFFGGTKRKGYWTEQDPHPHVNGRNGHACLGNVSSTIAELCSQMQIYALSLICIDFLESANTTDPAGKNVINWDEIKNGTVVSKVAPATEIIFDEVATEDYEDEEEDDRPIEDYEDEEEDDRPICDRCEEHVDEIFTVYEFVEIDGDGDPYASGEHYVCEYCRDNYYSYNEDLEAYIKD